MIYRIKLRMKLEEIEICGKSGGGSFAMGIDNEWMGCGGFIGYGGLAIGDWLWRYCE